MDENAQGLSRRELMRTAAAAGATAPAAAVAVASGSASAQEGEEGEVVDMNDQLQFAPADLTVEPGTTVVWETVGNQPHSVTAYEDDIPEEAEYWASGGFDSESAARENWPEGSVEEGETYEHTFEVEGTHEYFCFPHEGTGMVGSIEVSADAGGGGEPAAPAVTDSAKTIVVATVAAITSTLALAYAFVKYGGGRREE